MPPAFFDQPPAFFDHVTLRVRDYESSKRFYLAALQPFDPEVYEGEVHGIEGPTCGIGPKGGGTFWFAEGEPSGPIHVAFAAPDRATVDAFHTAALAAGGKDNGAPGLRPQYHDAYYGAYVLDPDGNNVEAVFHEHK
jgi:catechol 2,3-dioxygenase-like lactoylglutathione lyase family enzyme